MARKKSDQLGKIVLAYSGGLDTSVILPWLKDRYPGVKLVAFAAELGLGDELTGIREKALASGADQVVIKDLRHEFARDYCFALLRAHATYESDYLLGTSIARPLIAKHQVMVAKQTEALAQASHHMSVASHRLNVLAAFFFPISILTALIGVWVQRRRTVVFFTVLVGIWV